MSTTVFFTVLAAAVLHALWNAIVKDNADKFVSMTAMTLGQAPLAILALLVVPAPSAESLPYLLIAIVLHVFYQVFLSLAYKIGDLTQVYPIARGVAPLIVAGVSVLFLKVDLTRMEMLGIATIGAGIISLALVRKSDGQRNTQAAVLALITGCFIASYSLIDGIGARVAGSAIGFYGWIAIGTTVGYSTVMTVWKPGTVQEALRTRKLKGLFSGSASFVAFALVVWAFTQAPIALVTALRETSIIIALFIGVFVLKERLDLLKVFSTLVTIGGAALLKIARH